MQGLSISPILACFKSGEPVMHIQPNGWCPTGNLDSQFFAKNQKFWRSGLSYFDKDELKAFATTDPEELAKTMKEWGMRLAMPPVSPGSVYMISLYKAMVEWLYEGEEVFGRPWPEFKLDKAVSFFTHDLSDEPVVAIETKKAGDLVYVTRWDEALSGFDLLRHIEAIKLSMKLDYSPEYKGVQIPCVLGETEPKMNWLLGMKNGNWIVTFAKQKLWFGMNRFGFAQRDETQITTMKGNIGRALPPYILSPNGEKFLFWRDRLEVPVPVSMYQFEKSDFKDPGDLKDIVK